MLSSNRYGSGSRRRFRSRPGARGHATGRVEETAIFASADRAGLLLVEPGRGCKRDLHRINMQPPRRRRLTKPWRHWLRHSEGIVVCEAPKGPRKAASTTLRASTPEAGWPPPDAAMPRQGWSHGSCACRGAAKMRLKCDVGATQIGCIFAVTPFNSIITSIILSTKRR